MRVIIRMWTKDGYHKDVALLSEKQVHMTNGDMDVKMRHLFSGYQGPSVIVDSLQFPEAVEFQVIVEK